MEQFIEKFLTGQDSLQEAIDSVSLIIGDELSQQVLSSFAPKYASKAAEYAQIARNRHLNWKRLQMITEDESDLADVKPKEDLAVTIGRLQGHIDVLKVQAPILIRVGSYRRQ